MARQYLKTSEVAAMLGVSVQYVARQFRSGHLPGERKKERGMWRIRRSVLREYAEKAGLKLDWKALERLRERREERRLADKQQPAQRTLALQ